ncbi:hypothetical protein LWI29_021671 [Acer saccharum]|uniref:Mediator of RNA polymerase II transcription subunit 11 n=1 Tax=Acer saccharum TaxID=4024 RepID=A0AA39STL4_ACESA|nr:hypothetical protein LWI29_021671 [Acer saccharum]KAK1577000.1 hypothetical protein Q3G72_018249 [Acer saccharum]
MDSQSQTTSLQRLQNVEKRVVRVLELAGGVMDELANPTGPRKEFINNHCREFMQRIKDIQMTLRDEIKSACEYRPFEKPLMNIMIRLEAAYDIAIEREESGLQLGRFEISAAAFLLHVNVVHQFSKSVSFFNSPCRRCSSVFHALRSSGG